MEPRQCRRQRSAPALAPGALECVGEIRAMTAVAKPRPHFEFSRDGSSYLSYFAPAREVVAEFVDTMGRSFEGRPVSPRRNRALPGETGWKVLVRGCSPSAMPRFPGAAKTVGDFSALNPHAGDGSPASQGASRRQCRRYGLPLPTVRVLWCPLCPAGFPPPGKRALPLPTV